MEKLTKALMTDETGQAIVTKLTALSGQMHELAMATRGSAILFESESDISVLGDGGYLAVYVGSTNPLVISGWTGDNSLVTGHLYYLIKSGTAVASSDLGEYGGTAVTSTTFDKPGVPADDFAVGQALAEKADADDVDALDDRVTALEAGGSGSGLTDAQKRAILNCFAHVAWTDNQGQTYYDELEDVLFPPAELTRISAVYVNSGVVYPDANIEDLRQYITVTAHFSDSTTTTVNAYTLSGTLTVGTSVLTIAYEGKTTTVSVTVTEKPVSDMTHWTDGIKYTNIDVVENSYYNNRGGIASYNTWSRTGKIPCDGASTLVLKANGSGNIDKTYCWFFTQDGSPLENFASNPSMSADVTLTVPSTAYYFGISSQASQVSAQLTQGIYPYA